MEVARRSLSPDEIRDLHERIGYHPRRRSETTKAKALALKLEREELLRDPTSIASRLNAARRRHESRSGGMVYFLECGEFVKIGHSKDPTYRIGEFTNGNPYPMAIIHSINGRQALEKDIHRTLKDLHHKGEWFRLTDELRAAIKFAFWRTWKVESV